MLPRALRRIPSGLPLALAALSAASTAPAFCGFHVAGADAKLYSNAAIVVLMREGGRTWEENRRSWSSTESSFSSLASE